MAARESGLVVHALHVHHGLVAAADEWLAHGQSQCRRWAQRGLPVSFHAERLALLPARGESIEALARSARYAALRRMALAAGADLVLLAHHRRDQAETFLLQALRGAGAPGLAAMPACVERDGITWARPWLGWPREAIEAYARRHRLRHVEDPSNQNPKFARNRLRQAVWPAFAAAFPQAESALADAARHAQQAAACLADLALIDLRACSDERGLDLAAWRALAPHRAANALRAWLHAPSGRRPSAAELRRLMSELPAASAPACWAVSGSTVRRYRGRLRAEAAPAPAPAPALHRETQLCVARAGRYALPGWGGALIASGVEQGGAALATLERLVLRLRGGGERFSLSAARPARSLKKQYQALGVPAWERHGPLLLHGEQLVFAPGLGIEAAAQAAPGEPQLALRWEPTVPD